MMKAGPVHFMDSISASGDAFAFRIASGNRCLTAPQTPITQP